MVTIKIRCKNCNSYEVIEVDDDDYFKWIISNDINDLKLNIIDRILFSKKICNKCRIREIE